MIIAYTDGGSRGNPGPAGYGVRLVHPDGTVIAELRAPLGHVTNNVAEYEGLLAALRFALEHGHRIVHVRSDSELMVKQMRGEYRVKHAGLLPLVARARALVGQLERVTFQFVRREENAEADRLANLAMDEAARAGEPDGAASDESAG